MVAGGRVVNGNHGDGDGRWGATILQRASSPGDEKSPRHATSKTEEHTSSQCMMMMMMMMMMFVVPVITAEPL